MSIFDQVIEGKQPTPLKIVVYGDNGVGKSTFAAQALKPLFLDLEGNIDHLAVSKIRLDNWQAIISALDELTKSNPKGYKTLVIDSLEALEQMNWTNICNKKQAESITDKVKLPYGQGHSLAQEEAKSFLAKIDRLRASQGINIVLIGHHSIKKVDNPDLVEYDCFHLRLHEKFASLVCDWSHAILYAAYETQRAIDSQGHTIIVHEKVNSSSYDKRKRVLYTTGTSSILAKNVFNLPPKIDLDWRLFISLVTQFFNPNPARQGEQS